MQSSSNLKLNEKLALKQVLIVGTPNSGKSLLFNRLTGLNQKVANFPGVTVEVHSGTSRNDPNLEFIDFPGVYSINTLTEDERVAVRVLESELEKKNIQCVVCVLDATRLERSLLYGLQVLKRSRAYGHRMIFVANMLDELKSNNLSLDTQGLSKALGCPVLQLSARTKEGIVSLEAFIKEDAYISTSGSESLMEDDELTRLSHELARRYGPKGDYLIKTQYRFDRFLLSSVWGYPAFFGIMYLLFQSIFTWASPLMDGIESLIGLLAETTLHIIPQGFWSDFVKDAIFGGIGSFLVFIPQIFILSFVVGFLEDSGYLARAAVLCHRPLRFFGLTGKSFVPMLSGFACAIPGIYAARTIDSPKKRFLTYMAIPLMPCSARLPVYGLLIGALIPKKTIFGGLLGLQGLTLFAVYFFGLITALLVTGILSRTGYRKEDDTPFVLEMPPYRLPMWWTLLRHSWEKAQSFLMRAGGIIFIVTIVVWFLGYMPNRGEDLGASWLGSIGILIEPLVRPLGLDWKYAVAILTSFLAREVFVGTLGTLFGIEGADTNITHLGSGLQSSGLTLASGLGLLAFYAIAMQCVATLATIKRESGSWALPARIFVIYTLLAYTAAWAVNHIARL